MADVLFRFYCSGKIYGIDNLPAKPPYIIAPNHASTLDFVAVSWAMGGRREELFPLTTKYYYDMLGVGFLFRVAGNAIRIDTFVDFFAALKTAVKVLKAGRSVYLHPEGYRTIDGDLMKFRTGAGLLAVETEVPIIPVYLHNLWKVLPQTKFFPRHYPIAVSFGKPIEIGRYVEMKKVRPAHEIYREVTDTLKSRIIELKGKFDRRAQ
jgi:1-acyl-sn-glycerol-3-phosphate acyltransferase